MPHGGYHGVVKVGNKVVQQGSRPDGRGGQTGGGVYNPKGFKNEIAGGSTSNKSDQQIIQDQTKNIEGIEKIFKNRDDARGKFLALQTPKALLNKAKFRKNQTALRRKVMEDFRSGKNVDKSLFTGRSPIEGTKTSILNAFGIGTVPTGRAKLREGLSSSEYAQYMRDLYDANPAMMESLFPVASGKMIRNVSRLAPGFGTIQNLASAAKEKTGGFLNRFFPGLLPSSGIASTKQAQPTLAELNENAFRFASFRNAPTNIKDIKADNEKRDIYTNFTPTGAQFMFSMFPNRFGLFGGRQLEGQDFELYVPPATLFSTDSQRPNFFRDERGLDVSDAIMEASRPENLPNIDVSQEGIAPVLNTSNTLNQTGSTLTGLTGDSSIAQQKNFFENAIRGNTAGVPANIGQIYQNLLDSGALSSSEALQYGSFVRNLPPPSASYGLNPKIKPGIEGIDLQGNFPGVL